MHAHPIRRVPESAHELMHRWSQLFIPTLREAPADAEVASHKLLLRAGFVRQLGAGIYSYLFLGNRSVNKIVAIVREEMDTIGQEFLLPTLHPKEIWEASGRWTVMGDNMFRLKDRKGAELALGMTHEEVMTDIARNELRSYKQLPQIWYQIQTKFRDEPRPKSGLLRVRQFIMKDAYSFDIDDAGLDLSYDKHDRVYRNIFSRCGLEFLSVEADSGAMGGSQSQEFMVYTEAGEDLIASCPACNYAANLERATSTLAPVEDLAPTGDGLPELIHTPGMGAIADITAFLGISASQDIKCVAYMAVFIRPQDVPGKEFLWPVAAFLRGDQEANETKLIGALNKTIAIQEEEALIANRGRHSSILGSVVELRFMNPAELETYMQGPAGFLGPVGLKPADKVAAKDQLTIVIDKSLEGRHSLVAGANKLDYHYRNVTPGKDFTWTLSADIANVNSGEPCPVCGTPLRLGKAVEIGHIFKLGRRYTDSMKATVLNRDGKETTPTMGSYGIGIERILTAAIETSAAKFAAEGKPDTYALPAAIAPFEVVVTVTNTTDATLAAAGETIATELEAAGFDVLLDDRDERAGVKFKDADLIGIPYRINIGKKLAEGKVELIDRLTGQTQDVPTVETVQHLRTLYPR
jgi:prolyl-tRNA synthetase